MLIAGFLISRRGSRLIADFGGVQKVAPILAGTFLIGGLATLSLPGLAPFVSEFLVLVGTFTRYPVIGIIATLGIVLAALYTLVLYQAVAGPVKAEVNGMPDLRVRELVVVAPLVALLIFLGRLPQARDGHRQPGGGADHVRRTQNGPQPEVEAASERDRPSTACGQRRRRRPTRSPRSTRRRSSTGSFRPSSSSSARRSSESWSRPSCRAGPATTRRCSCPPSR
ncbi:hypothetical protein SVIOM342S_03229 [Streptomyces violaceorubidus]